MMVPMTFGKKKRLGGQAAWISFWVGLCRVLRSKCSIMTWLWHGTTCSWAESRYAQSCLVTSASSRPLDGSSFSCDNLSLATSFSYCWDWRCICCGHSYPFALHAWPLGPWKFLLLMVCYLNIISMIHKLWRIESGDQLHNNVIRTLERDNSLRTIW
jgi:hypothetical protein